MKKIIFFLLILLIINYSVNSQENKNMDSKEKLLQTVLDNTVDKKKVYGATYALKKDSFVWVGKAGNFSENELFFIASTTKLFTTSIILKLKSEGKLKLDDKISNYLDTSIIEGLHIYKGKDNSFELTVKHLLSHTSGLPDYFEDKGDNNVSLKNELTEGKDRAWTFEQSINLTKSLKPKFAPGTKGKAHYSDANFQLLGKIIENITGTSFEENCYNLIIKPLYLFNTYLYTDTSDNKPKNIYFKSKELHIPKAMASFGADGGIVSTSSDLLVFIEAFFTGKLFPIEYIEDLKIWNNIFFPMRSGIGIHLFKLPWFFDPTGAIPGYIGHSGLSGALAFYCPKENIFLAGTINQAAYPDIAFKTMIKLTKILIKK
jgi:CubicO group peptidase (beta-lactamase class C family)